ALEGVIKRLEQPRLLHIATHGFFLADAKVDADDVSGIDEVRELDDPMLRSGLYFAGANRTLAGHAPPGDLDDGVLTAFEAASLNLQGTELVVLSACETGRGDVVTGEGVVSL